MRKIAFRIFNFILLPSLVTGVLAALFAFVIKVIAKGAEQLLFDHATSTPLIIIIPLIGVGIIYLVKKNIFRNKQNKGINELLETIHHSTNHLAPFKVVSHFLFGIITVVFGGSTGIEESTLVSTGTIGNVIAKQGRKFLLYKNIFTSSGAAAGITALFGSPVAGFFFAYEVLRVRLSVYQITSFLLAISSAWGISYLTGTLPLFEIRIYHWSLHSLPYFALLGVLAGLSSIYLTKSILFIKKISQNIDNDLLRLSTIGILIGCILLIIPSLYGDGYWFIKHLLLPSTFREFNGKELLVLLATFLLKPIITSLTLSGDGEGGIFAPGLFMGALLGLISSILLNHYFHTNIDEANFLLVGMAATLSASANAPLMASFIVCSITGNYVLIIPILIATITSKITSQLIFLYTIYSYKEQ